MKVHKNLYNLFRDCKQNGTPMTIASKHLADFARSQGWPNVDQMRITKKVLTNKKGTALELLPIILALFVLGVTVSIMFVIWTQLTATGLLSTTTESAHIVAVTNQQWGVWDNLFIAVLIGLSLTTIISAALTRTTPLYFFISIILLSVVLTFTAMVANAFENITGQLPSYVQTSFPKMFFIMENLGLYALGVGVLVTIAFFGVRQNAL